MTRCSGAPGPEVFGAHYLHDGAQPEGSGQRTRWGNCWVVVVLVLELPCLGGRTVGLPVLFRLFEPKDQARPELDGDRPSQAELARALIDMILALFPGRIVELVMDGTRARRGAGCLTASRSRPGCAQTLGSAAAPAARRPGQQGHPAEGQAAEVIAP